MIRYAIIENEGFSRINLINQIKALRPDWSPVFTAETVEDSVDFFSRDRSADIDIVFIDIELDDGSCFDILRQLNEEGVPALYDIPVVFTTSYNQYALEAFKVNSVDYLLKPIQDDDLKRAIEKWERTGRNRKCGAYEIEKLLESFGTWLSSGSIPSRNECAVPVRRILISSGESYYYVETDEVAFFLAEDKAVYAVMKDSGRRRLTGFMSLGDLMPVLSKQDFFQLSRGVIANIGSISRVSKYFKGRLRVTLQAGETEMKITVTAPRKPEFLLWYGYNC